MASKIIKNIGNGILYTNVLAYFGASWSQHEASEKKQKVLE